MVNSKISPLIDYQYKGPGRRKAYFEGWYFKLNLTDETTLSLIPSLHQQGDVSYASLQWILAKGQDVRSFALTYPSGSFSLTLKPFRLVLGQSYFSETDIRIQEDELQLSVHFQNLNQYTGDIMGPFRWFHTRMPCSHGLLVISGSAQVTLESAQLQGRFKSGLYVEKDWGDTFPQRYIWCQAGFPRQNAAFYFSIATVRVDHLSFTGFIANLTLQEKNFTFATWNFSDCKVLGNPADIRIGLARSDLMAAARIMPQPGVHLNSPVQGMMDSTIFESLSAPLELKIKTLGNSATFFTERAAVECHNWYDSIAQPGSK